MESDPWVEQMQILPQAQISHNLVFTLAPDTKVLYLAREKRVD